MTTLIRDPALRKVLGRVPVGQYIDIQFNHSNCHDLNELVRTGKLKMICIKTNADLIWEDPVIQYLKIIPIDIN
jgi:hypothetical protein